MINAVNEFLDDLRGGKMSEAPIVKVEHGELQGAVATDPNGKAYYTFKGIPYAKPPLGSLRFKAPQPLEPWEGVRDATDNGNQSSQVDFFGDKSYLGDENCLFINVSTPALDRKLPVMVWVHGGGFRIGSGSTANYGPEYLVSKDVVVVSFNYRCGVLGFLCLNTPEVPGNAGLKDQAFALQWIKKNISNFGGDANNITIFGESAGGASVTLLAASPMTKNLISKVIIQSGTAFSNWSVQRKPVESAKTLAKHLGCDSEDINDVYEHLLTTPAKDLVETVEKVNPFGLFFGVENFVGYVVEKEFLGVEPFLSENFSDIVTSGRFADVPIMIGRTALEFMQEHSSNDYQDFVPAEFNLPRDSEESRLISDQINSLYFEGSYSPDKLVKYHELVSDFTINYPTHRLIKYLNQTSTKPIFVYLFDYVGNINLSKKMYNVTLTHAGHADEVGYLFNDELLRDMEPSPEDLKTRERMVRLWTDFAKSSNPTPEENHHINVTWPPISRDEINYLLIADGLSVHANPDQKRMTFWDNLYEKYYKIWEQNTTQDDASHVTRSLAAVNLENGDVVKENTDAVPEKIDAEPEKVDVAAEIVESAPEKVSIEEESVKVVSEITDAATKIVDAKENGHGASENGHAQETVDAVAEKIDVVPEKIETVAEKVVEAEKIVKANGTERKSRTSNEIKMLGSNSAPKDVIRSSDPPEDDLPKNIGVNKFVNFFESLGGKKK